jgi:hypothetical protein
MWSHKWQKVASKHRTSEGHFVSHKMTKKKPSHVSQVDSESMAMQTRLQHTTRTFFGIYWNDWHFFWTPQPPSPPPHPLETNCNHVKCGRGELNYIIELITDVPTSTHQCTKQGWMICGQKKHFLHRILALFVNHHGR